MALPETDFINVRFDPSLVSPQSQILPPVTLRQAGLMTPALLADLLALAPPSGQPAPGLENIYRYARPTGSDTTGDGTLANPYLTPERCVADPWEAGAQLYVDMTGYGTYTPAGVFSLPERVAGPTIYFPDSGDDLAAFGVFLRSDINIYAEPNVELVLAAASYTTATNATTRRVTITKAGAGWAVNQFAGMMIKNPALAMLGRVISNDATNLIVTLIDLTGPPAGELTIMSESATIDLSTAGLWFASDTYGRGIPYSITLAGLAFTGGLAFFNFRAAVTQLIGCSGMSALRIYGSVLGAYGCTFESNLDLYLLETAIFNECVFSALGTCANNIGRLCIIGGYASGGCSYGDSFYHGIVNQNIRGAASIFFSTNQDTAQAGARVVGINALLAIGFCQFDTCAEGGVRLERGARCLVNGPLGGAGNAAGGMLVLDDSNLFFQPNNELNNAVINAGVITVTGAAGDLIVGANPMRTWVSFWATYPLRVEQDLTRTSAVAYQRGSDNTMFTLLATRTTAQRPVAPPDGTTMFDSTLNMQITFFGGLWYSNGVSV